MNGAPPPARSLGVLARLSDWRARLGDLAAVGGFTAIFMVFSRAFLYTPINIDEQYFLAEGFFLGKGLVPYRDFQEFKPPFVFLMNMLAIAFFGVEGMRYRYFFTLFVFAAFLVIVLALRSRRVPALIVIAVAALMLNLFFDSRFHDARTLNTSEDAGLGCFLLAVGTLLFKVRGARAPRWRRWQRWIGGALFALAPLSKEPFLLPTVFAWVTLGLLHEVESDEPGPWRRFAKDTWSAVAAVAGLWLLYMLVTRSFGWYLVTLRETLIYSAHHNEMYGVFPPHLPFLARLAESWRRLGAKYVNPGTLAAFVPYFLAALFMWRRRQVQLAVAITATFLGGLYAVSVGNGFFGHYFIMGLTGSLFAATLGAVALAPWLATIDARGRRWVGLALSVSLLYQLQPRLSHDLDAWGTFRPQDGGPFPPRLVEVIKTHSAPSDRIWIIGGAGLYVYADRRTASRIPYIHDSLLHLYAGATDAERLAPFRAELDAHMPKLVILTEARPGREKHMDLLVDPFLRDHGYRPLVVSPPAGAPVFERPY